MFVQFDFDLFSLVQFDSLTKLCVIIMQQFLVTCIFFSAQSLGGGMYVCIFMVSAVVPPRSFMLHCFKSCHANCFNCLAGFLNFAPKNEMLPLSLRNLNTTLHAASCASSEVHLSQAAAAKIVVKCSRRPERTVGPKLFPWVSNIYFCKPTVILLSLNLQK